MKQTDENQGCFSHFLIDRNSKSVTLKGFQVSDETDGYCLSFKSVSGPADFVKGIEYHKGMRFSTEDKDQDIWKGNCAKAFKSGWWHKKCHYLNPNGINWS